ncbi:winged helix-turn-helix domain-containing protein [Actinomadura madurae]|nr:winged helix-turn-helix domain-containing protein [Actinomadura madurae]MCP9951977.1 winged helix-turn-helix domain-containing protein [Actinomadura madurae]MCP9968740.1 winged helix-turn-helix domain-containing protein [Actinomadura madurae]
MLVVEVLGPLRVSVDGRAVELPRGRLRALLAVLAMSAGRTVPTDRLAIAMWGTDTNGDPRVNVRTNVKRLRRALGPAAGQLIAARAGGYLLAAEPDQVDALRFGRLLDEAGAVSDRARERSRLAAALALWRGTPFEGDPVGLAGAVRGPGAAGAVPGRAGAAGRSGSREPIAFRPGRAGRARRAGRAASAAGVPLGAAAAGPGVGGPPRRGAGAVRDDSVSACRGTRCRSQPRAAAAPRRNARRRRCLR